MEIRKTENNGEMVLNLIGWLDTQEAVRLEQELGQIQKDKLERLVFDLAELEYVASSGLRQFVSAYKMMGKKFVLRNVSENIRGILKTTGLDKRLVIE